MDEGTTFKQSLHPMLTPPSLDASTTCAKDKLSRHIPNSLIKKKKKQWLKQGGATFDMPQVRKDW